MGHPIDLKFWKWISPYIISTIPYAIITIFSSILYYAVWRDWLIIFSWGKEAVAGIFTAMYLFGFAMGQKFPLDKKTI